MNQVPASPPSSAQALPPVDAPGRTVRMLGRSAPVDRIAFATAGPSALILGDHSGSHVLLAPEFVACGRAGSDEPIAAFEWSTLRLLEVAAPSMVTREGAGALTALRRALRRLRPDSGARAGVLVTIDDRRGALAFPCDGSEIYWRAQVEAIQAGVHILAAHPAARDSLRAPSAMIADLHHVVGRDRAAARASLGRLWGGACRCR